MGEKRLEVNVPDPRDVLTVCDRIVERYQEHGRHPRLEESERLVRGCRVLDQEDDDRLGTIKDPLEAANAALKSAGPRVIVAGEVLSKRD